MRLQTQLLIFAIAFAGCGTGDRDGRCDCDVGEACIEGTCIPRDRPEMLSVAAGAFTMGTPLTESDRDEDEVEHEVTISALYAAKIEVTQAQYEAIMGENPSSFFTCPTCPVEGVSWFDAVRYANALSTAEGLSTCYVIEGSNVSWPLGPSCEGYRLPTESEWEYVARAASSEARYGELDDIAWYASNSPFSTQPVGQKEPNAWGFFDMLGNVWEWCWDGYDEYPDGPVENPIGADEAIRRVFRGGSWAEDESFLRVGNRNRADPEVSGNRVGFRVVRR